MGVKLVVLEGCGVVGAGAGVVVVVVVVVDVDVDVVVGRAVVVVVLLVVAQARVTFVRMFGSIRQTVKLAIVPTSSCGVSSRSMTPSTLLLSRSMLNAGPASVSLKTETWSTATPYLLGSRIIVAM